jgi:hypothetical protein
MLEKRGVLRSAQMMHIAINVQTTNSMQKVNHEKQKICV